MMISSQLKIFHVSSDISAHLPLGFSHRLHSFVCLKQLTVRFVSTCPTVFPSTFTVRTVMGYTLMGHKLSAFPERTEHDMG